MVVVADFFVSRVDTGATGDCDGRSGVGSGDGTRKVESAVN